MDAIGYVRTSTFLQESSVEAQREKIKKYCQAKGWKLLKIYTDEGKSGSNIKRPAWQKLIAERDEHKFDVLVFTKLDRISRSLSDLLLIVAEFEKENVKISSIDDNIDTQGAQGRLMLSIMGAFSEFERSIIRERLVRGMERAKAKGVKFGRKRIHIDKDKALELHKLGLSVSKLGKHFGVSRLTMHKRLVEWGVR